MKVSKGCVVYSLVVATVSSAFQPPNPSRRSWCPSCSSVLLRARNVDEDYYVRLYNTEIRRQQQQEEDFERLRDRMEKTMSYRKRCEEEKKWNLELEQWKREGIQKRKEWRHDAKMEKVAMKSEMLAIQELNLEEVPSGLSEEYPAFLLATNFFRRLLTKLVDMESEAQCRAKEMIQQREAEVVKGVEVGDSDIYLDNIERIRFEELERRKEFQERIFRLPKKERENYSNEYLCSLLEIRGNVAEKIDTEDRKLVLRCVAKSYSKPLF